MSNIKKTEGEALKLPFYEKHFAVKGIYSMPYATGLKLIEERKWFVYDYIESLLILKNTEDLVEARRHFDRCEEIRCDVRIQDLPEYRRILKKKTEDSEIKIGNPEFERALNQIYLKKHKGQPVVISDYRDYAKELEVYMANGFGRPYIPSNLS